MVTNRKRKKGTWSESALRVLRERYLWKKDGQIVEDPDGMCWRVARAVADAEKYYPDSGVSVEETAEAFYNLMVERKFLPNSPTLMNAGKGNNLQLSACFVIPVPDSIDGIFEAVKHAAVVHKSGGGTGFAFSRLRAEGSVVGSTQGVASGPVSFMKIFDAATEQIKQGGTRRGANMGILRVDHPDILKFIECKLNGGITNFNISCTITDAFMEALENDTEYTLHAPPDMKPAGTLRARDVFEHICQAAWATGDPGLVFIDRINHSAANPVPEIEQIEATNPCGEQPLAPYDACNLGSINLERFVTPEGAEPFDWVELERATRLATRFLDDVIDINPYPLAEIHKTVKANRRIGLGVMGWADALFRLGIPYDSEDALQLAERVMHFINEVGHSESEKLATERGPFPNWSKSIYRDGRPVRNSTVTTIAPTGTISILADCSSGIEPIFALAYTHTANGRTLRFMNPIFEGLARAQGYGTDEVLDAVAHHGSVHGVDGVPDEAQRIFVTAHEIAPPWHVRMQAAFQKSVDNGVSKTINLPNQATLEDIRKAYLLAWETGCRGITVFRDGCKGMQVLNVGVSDTPKESEATSASGQTKSESKDTQPARLKPRPAVVHGYTRNVKAPEGTLNITINSDESGPVEVFVNVGKAGSDIAAMAEAVGRLISLSLRLPSPMSTEERVLHIADQLRGIGGSRSIGMGPKQVRSLPDAVARVLDEHLSEHAVKDASRKEPDVHQRNGNGNGKAKQDVKALQPIWTGNLCPSCGCSTLAYEEGCKKCHACGHSEC